MGKVLVKASGGGGGVGGGDVASLLGGLVGRPKTGLGGAFAGGLGGLQFLTSLADAGANEQDIVSALSSAGGRAYATGTGAGKVGDAMNPALLKPYRSLQYHAPGGHKQQASMRAAVNANPPPLFPPPPTSPATIIPPLTNVMRPAPPPPLATTTTPPLATTTLSPPVIPNTAPKPDAYERAWGTEGSPDWYQEKTPTGGTDFDMQNMTDQSATGNSMADVDEFPLEITTPAPPTVTTETEMPPPGYDLATPNEESDEESEDELLQRVLSGGVEMPKSEPMEIAFRLLKAVAR